MIIYTGNYKLCLSELLLKKGYSVNSQYTESCKDVWIPSAILKNTIIDRPGALQSERCQYELGIQFCSIPGIKVFTHSEMFLNGVRIGVKRELINHKDVEIIYYPESGDCLNVYIKPNGGIEHWPVGFFDVMDESFRELFGI